MFGASAPAPFGASPAPAFGSFGSTTTPAPAAPSAFGAAPSFGGFGAPAAPSFGGFGAPAAPSPSSFGAPAPSFGGFGAAAPAMFGSTAPPAFGAPAPAPAFGGFGSSPAAPAPLGAPAAPTGGPSISGNMPYASLSPQARACIDQIHSNMMLHKTTLVHVQSIGPRALQMPSDRVAPAVTATDATNLPLPLAVERLQKQVQRLNQDINSLSHRAVKAKQNSEELTKQAYTYGKWPIEAVAARRGLRLSVPQQQQQHATFAEEKKESDGNNDSDTTTSSAATTQNRLRQILDTASITVDRIERMPSPYFFQLLHDFERRIRESYDPLNRLHLVLAQNRRMLQTTTTADPHHQQQQSLPIASMVEEQHRAIMVAASQISQLSRGVEELRQLYHRYEPGDTNVLDMARWDEMQHERNVNDEIERMYVSATTTTTMAAPGSTTAPATVSAFGVAAAPSFGRSPTTPAPGGAFLFGVGTTAPATSTTTPAPTAFGFSGTTTPAPSGFGTAPAFGAAPSGFAFGPAPGGLDSFGATSGFSNSTPVPLTPKKKSASRSGGRLRK